MKYYILYMLTGLLNFWMILVYLGFSAGFANYFPIIALIGALIVFVPAASVLVYRMRLGVIIGLIGSLLMLPYCLGFVASVFKDNTFNWAVILILLPTVLTLLSIIFSIKPLFKNTAEQAIASGRVIKAVLSGIPVALFLLYIIFYGKYWV